MIPQFVHHLCDATSSCLTSSRRFGTQSTAPNRFCDHHTPSHTLNQLVMFSSSPCFIDFYQRSPKVHSASDPATNHGRRMLGRFHARSEVTVPRGDGVIAPRRKRFLSIRRLILQTRRSAPMPSVSDWGIKPCLVSGHSRITSAGRGYRGGIEGDRYSWPFPPGKT